MRRLMASILTGAVLLAALPGALAQEKVVVAGVEATRIVIAPPRTELARIIKAGLSDAYVSANRETRAYLQAQQLYYFYGARYFEPLWLTESEDGKIAFSASAEKIIEVFKAAELEGFRPSDYLTPELDVAAAGTDPARLAALETAFSAAAIRYAQDAYGGRIAPSEVGRLVTIKPRKIDAAELLIKLAETDDPAGVLRDLHPKQREFLQLRKALAEFDDRVVEEQTSIPDGPVLKPGMKDARVPLLRLRLNLEERAIAESAVTAEPDLVYDDALVEAIKSFQGSLGLIVDGIVGPATVASLNGGGATTREDIVANMERWRWMPSDLGDFYVLVNIPEFRLAIMKTDELVYSTKVVVGKPEFQTPIFADQIENIVVNPFWNVPSNIANNEIVPRIVSNPGYLASQNMELLKGGKVINASAVDWSTLPQGRFPFAIRQRPGNDNALGKIKFLFPNEHDVYLHDTPAKSLFNSSVRAYSHGCVRVQNPMEFADALLANEPGLSAAALEAMYGKNERWVKLKTPIPVYLAYFTLRVDEDGTIRSYGDVYGLNKRLISLLSE